MAFEKIVLDKVAKVLKDDNRAAFICGTLFVECSEVEARKVFHKLSKDYGLGKIQVSGPIPNGADVMPEFAYDFI
jgi:hypothetical protein